MTTRLKRPGGRPAVWGEREAKTIRVPKMIKTLLEKHAAPTGDKVAVYCVRALAADHGVQLDPNADQLVLLHERHAATQLDADDLVPTSWDNRILMNIRPTLRLRAALIDAAAEVGVPWAEYCVIRLAALHGFSLRPSNQPALPSADWAAQERRVS